MKNKYSGFKAWRQKLTIPILFAFCLLFGGLPKAHAQRGLPCGQYKINKEAIKAAQEFEKSTVEGTQTLSYQIRVVFNVVSTDNGQLPAANLAQLEFEYSQLVSDYAPAGICFINMGIHYINSTKLDTNFNINTDDPSLFDPYRTPNCLNVFYCQKIKGSNGACNSCGIGGVTLNIPNTFCLVASSNLGVGHSTSHETGHCLGLLHPFETAYGEEDINESNAATAGDLVTDTRADPFSFNGQPCFTFNKQGIYTGNCQDPNGQTNYTPPYTNIMSYWWAKLPNAGLDTTLFLTAGQYTRARAILSSFNDLINCQSATTPVTIGAQNVASQYLISSSTGPITTNGAINITGTSDAVLQGQSVVLAPGFFAAPSAVGYYVEILPNAPCSPGSGSATNTPVTAATVEQLKVNTASQNTLTVYPNPASTQVTIALTLAHAQKNVAVQLYDMNGKKVKETDLSNLYQGVQNVTLPVSNLASGLYLLMVRMDDAMLNSKIIVAK